MENSFVDEIVKKIIEKIKVTGKYKSVFANLDSNNSASKVIVNFCEILFNKVWDENEEKIVPVYKRVIDENGDKEKIKDDYVGRNQVFESTQGEEQNLYKIISPLVAIMKNFNEEMPEEMKLVLLADCFNTIAHNVEIIFGGYNGQTFWYDLKNDILKEMIEKFTKDNVFVEAVGGETFTVSFRVKFVNEYRYFSWHTKGSFLRSIPGFSFSDYKKPPQNCREYNHNLYNSIFEHTGSERSISDIFRVEYPKESEQQKQGAKKLVGEIAKADSQQMIEDLINQSDFADQIQNLRILRLRGCKRTFYVVLDINNESTAIRCKDGFECEYTGECYTKAQIEEMVKPKNQDIEEESPVIQSKTNEERAETITEETTEEIIDDIEVPVTSTENKECAKQNLTVFQSNRVNTSLTLSQLDKLIQGSDFSELVGILSENKELQKIFEVLSHETINPEDIVSRSVAFAIGLDILVKNGAPDELKKLQEQVLEILIKDLISKNNISFLEYAKLRSDEVKLYIEIKLDETHTTLIPASEEFYRYMSKEINLNREEKGYINPLIVSPKSLKKREFDKLSDGNSIEEIVARFSDEIPERIVDVEIDDEIRDTFEGGGSYDAVIKEEHIQSDVTIEESVEEEAHVLENQNGDSSSRMEEQVDESAKGLTEKNEEEVHVVENQNGDSSTKMEDQIGECLTSKKEQLNRITAELSASEMYEHILFCVETMLPEEKFSILEAQLEQMSPSEEYMFLLKMLEKFKPVRDKNDGKDDRPDDNKRGGGPRR